MKRVDFILFKPRPEEGEKVYVGVNPIFILTQAQKGPEGRLYDALLLTVPEYENTQHISKIMQNTYTQLCRVHLERSLNMNTVVHANSQWNV